tara:strand:+ start:17 stop:706 length:690 start_codon:yes stop_codon:yes gene_type:complete
MELELQNYNPKIALVIPIKLNNERLPGKTFLPLHNKALCEYTFNRSVHFKFHMKNNYDIDIELYVYCSNDEICNWLPNPHITFVERPTNLDGNNTLMNEVLSNFANTIIADIYLVQFITTPYLKVDSMVKAFNIMINDNLDSIYSVKRVKSFIDYRGFAVNYNPQAVEKTQDIIPIEIQTSGFYYMTREILLLNRRIGFISSSYPLSDIECIDIDTHEDLEFANMIKIP